MHSPKITVVETENNTAGRLHVDTAADSLDARTSK